MMASRNVKLSSVQGFDTGNINDKMQSSTLKRQPSPDWSKADLLRLLSYFEGELQARDIAIATLKAEKAKHLLYQAKYGRFGLGDPFVALQRDAEGKNDTGFDEAAIKCMYDNQLAQLENLIATQRKAQLKMREQLGNSEKRFHKLCTELEEEKQKHAQDTAQGDDVTYMLEKERERLKAEIDFEKSQNKKLEKDLKKTLASLEEERANASRHKQVALMLIKERKNLIERLVAENHLRDEMESALTDGKSKIQNMAEGLVQESKKSLKMEAAMDKQNTKFDSERETLKLRLQEEEKQTNVLRAEVSRLSKQLESLQVQVRNSASPNVSQLRSSVSPARTSTSIGRGTSQSVSPSPNNAPPQGYSPQPITAAAGARQGHGMSSKIYAAQAGAKVSEGVHINSSPEKDVLKPDTTSSAGNIARRGHGGMRVGNINVDVDFVPGARVLSVSPGSPATVSTHGGGKISFHVAGSQGSGQSSIRKTTSFSSTSAPALGRGVPPPLPPNKPNFVTSVASSPKPSPPPKVSVVSSSVPLQSSAQEHPGKGQRAVPIPVTVVSTGSSLGSGQPSPSSTIASVRTQVRETSPSAVRKTSQPLVVSTAAVVDSHPCSNNLEFLAPEMANLQNVLASMLTGETSACNTHVITSTKQDTFSSSTSVHHETLNSDTSKLCTNPQHNSSNLLNQEDEDYHKEADVVTPLNNDKHSMPSENKEYPSTYVSQDHTPHHVYEENAECRHQASVSNHILQSGNQNSIVNQINVRTTQCMTTAGSRSPTKSSYHFHSHNTVSSPYSFSPAPQCLDEPLVHNLTSKGHVPALQQLLLASPSCVNMTSRDGMTPLHKAAENNQKDCLHLLLEAGAVPDVYRLDQMTPLHIACLKGYSRCVDVLVSHGASVNLLANKNKTPLHLAANGGHLECCQILVASQAEIMLTDQDGLTCVHYAVQNNHCHIVKLLLDKLKLHNQHEDILYQLMAMTDADYWTLTHMAAYLPRPECLHILAENLTLDLGVKDKLGRTAMAVASASCRGILAELDQSVKPTLKVNVELQYILETKVVSTVQIGQLDIGPGMGWKYLEDKLRATLDTYFSYLDMGLKSRRISRLDGDNNRDFTLGISVASITQYELGFYKWTPGMQTDTLPYAMLSNNQHRIITVIVDDSGNMSELIAFDVLQPVVTINNYLRLLEQYKTVIFYGPAGSGKSYLAQRLVQRIAAQEMSQGRKPGIHQLALQTGYTWPDFFRFLKEKSCLAPVDKPFENIAPIVVLDDLENVDMADLFGELIDAMEYRGTNHTFSIKCDQQNNNKLFYLNDHFFLVGTMNKSRSLGVNLSILPRFRWVQFRLDTEPLRGLLARHFLRRMFNIYHGQLPASDDPLLLAVEWIVCVWHRLNDSLNKLGLMDVVVGPCSFFRCPIEKQDPKKIFEWLKNFWNKKIVPRVIESVRRGTGSETPPNGHNKVASTALYVLMQRSVILSCPLSGQEKDCYLSEFYGSNELDIPLKCGDTSSEKASFRKYRCESEEKTSPSVKNRGRTSKQEKQSDDSSLTLNIKRSLSESSVSKVLRLSQPNELDGRMSPTSSQAKMAKLEVKSPKLVSIKTSFFGSSFDTSQKNDVSSSKLDTEKTQLSSISPLLSLVGSKSPQKSRSAENISNSASSSKRKSSGTFSFSLATPKSPMLMFLENFEERATEKMPDFSIFDKVSTPTEVFKKDFTFSVKNTEESQNKN